jgi:hypothetical protein
MRYLVVKFIETEDRRVIARGGGGGNEELLFHTVSVFEMERVQ